MEPSTGASPKVLRVARFPPSDYVEPETPSQHELTSSGLGPSTWKDRTATRRKCSFAPESGARPVSNWGAWDSGAFADKCRRRETLRPVPRDMVHPRRVAPPLPLATKARAG
jgi:hypothetical protein